MRFILLFLILIINYSSYSQSISIKSIDESEFPIIRLIVSINSESNKLEDNIKIIENSKNIIPEIKSIKNKNFVNQRNICILIENSFYIYKNKLHNSIKKTLQESLSVLDKQDRINVLYFGKLTNSNCNVCYLSAAPSSNKKLFNKIITDNYLPSTDSSYFNNELYKSILEASKYLSNEEFINDEKIIILISRALNLSDELHNLNDSIIQFLNKKQIQFNSIIINTESKNALQELQKLSSKTKGEFHIIAVSELEQQIIQSIEKIKNIKSSNQQNTFEISFKTSQKGSLNSFKLITEDKEIESSFRNPRHNGFIYKNLNIVFIVSFVFIIFIIVFLYYYNKSKIIKIIKKKELVYIKDIEKQNKILRKEIEKYHANPGKAIPDFNQFNSNKTIVGSGGAVPEIMIQAENFSKSFEITKLLMSIGRDLNNDIVIPDQTISAQHATLSNEGGFFYISDHNSTNGIFVNDIRINKSRIQTDDNIRMGAVFLKIKY